MRLFYDLKTLLLYAAGHLPELNLFRHAKLVIGPHGGAFMNLMMYALPEPNAGRGARL